MQTGNLNGAGSGPAPFCLSSDPPPALDQFVARIDPDRVFFLKFILEGYDNLYISTTLHRSGVVLIRAVSGTGDELKGILDSIREKIGLVCIEQV